MLSLRLCGAHRSWACWRRVVFISMLRCISLRARPLRF